MILKGRRLHEDAIMIAAAERIVTVLLQDFSTET
jgi:hypothetical protein